MPLPAGDFLSDARHFAETGDAVVDVGVGAEQLGHAAAEEGGDLLFAAVNVLRLAGVESERALAAATEKFIERFLRTEELAKADGREMATLSAEETDIYYNEAKKR